MEKEEDLPLIESTLSNMQIYTMSSFWLPKGRREVQKKFKRTSLWRLQFKEEFTFDFLGNICSSKIKGGLGIRRLYNEQGIPLADGFGDLQWRTIPLGNM